ncbi:MAG: glutamate-1-semialdehyde 2,1-aminomutase [Parcubacteria group bacterium]|nr:glutamate-1-semialdehyde 2,1-aminomutase [Parcubacteria group bacterium]
MNEKDLKKRIHNIIPGGAHTYSRGDDQFPSNVPAVLVKGKGAYSWGSNGKKYLDYAMGVRAVSIGYANKDIDNAAIKEIKKGNNLSKASMTELLAAEKILELFPEMDMVKFAKNGSTVTTSAVKLARAYTGRKYVVRCKDHPFFSYDDWFIGDTVINRGIPEEISSLTLNFEFNNIESLKSVFNNHKNEIACVILEPTTHIEPKEGFLKEVKELTHKNGAVLIFDEISCCFRVDYAVYRKYGVVPDLVTIGKAIANGYAVDALLGKREIMNLGGIYHNQERVFLTSTTFGATMSGLGALMATIDYYKKNNVLRYLLEYERKLKDDVNKISESFSLKEYFYFEGSSGRLNYVTKDENKEDSYKFKTLFSQEMIKNNILMNGIAPSFSHKEKELEKTLVAIEKTLNIYRKALEDGIDKYVKPPFIKPVFRKYNQCVLNE